MSSLKQIKLAGKATVLHHQVIGELQSLAKDIERCEKTMSDLTRELQSINEKHQGRKTTRDDIAYLTDLLECAKKKLTWEKHIASLQKRTPTILEKMSKLLTDPQNPPSEQLRADMLTSLQAVQATMERLQSIKTE